MSLEADTQRATVGALRAEIRRLEAQCDRLYHALACALTVPTPETDDQQRMLDWARAVAGGSPKATHQTALVAVKKYIASACEHDWYYSHHKGGMACTMCEEFESDQL